MTRIKICGVTRLEDALAAARLGAAAIGMVFSPSPRQIDRDRARRICRELPPYVDRVGVFLNEPAGRIREIVRAAGLTRVQLHGQELPAMAREIPVALTRALAIHEPGIDEQAKAWTAARDDTQFLLDLLKERNTSWNEELLDRAAAFARLHKVTVAGNLDEDSVLDVLERVRPSAVDVARGVESAVGIKDPARLKAFCEAVRRHDAIAREAP